MSEPVTDDVRAAGTGWFTALMLLLVISLVAVSVITAIKCRIGAIYPGNCILMISYCIINSIRHDDNAYADDLQ